MPDATTLATRRPWSLPVRAVLFDLDGTLADTAADLAAALNRVRADRGLPALPVATLRPYSSHGARGLIGAGLGIERDSPEFEPLRNAFLAHYADALFEHTRLFAGVEDVLAEIERRGLAWGIVTNKAARFTLPLLEHLALSKRAATIISGDTTPQTKPHPAPLLLAASELAIAPLECVYVGDAERDIVAGNAAGMRTLVARYGYISDDELPENWPADGMIASASALLHWLPPSATFSRGRLPH